MTRSFLHSLKPLYPFVWSILAFTPLVFLAKERVFECLNQLHHPQLDYVFRFITYLGDASYAVVLLLFLLYKKPFKWAFVFTLGFAFHAFFVHVFKQWLAHGELRPYGYYLSLAQIDQFHWVEGISMKVMNSFPSGHTATVFFFASFFACYLRNKWANIVLLALAFAAAISRVYLGQHWFIDIYAGSLFGIASSVLAFWIVWVFPKNWHDRQWL
jgi:membrane-associated phospholipid phosphatase